MKNESRLPVEEAFETVKTLTKQLHEAVIKLERVVVSETDKEKWNEDLLKSIGFCDGLFEYLVQRRTQISILVLSQVYKRQRVTPSTMSNSLATGMLSAIKSCSCGTCIFCREFLNASKESEKTGSSKPTDQTNEKVFQSMRDAAKQVVENVMKTLGHRSLVGSSGNPLS
jgi:hypothetical protein